MSALLPAALHTLGPRAVIVAVLAWGLGAPVQAQEPAPAEPPAAETPAPKPKPRPKSKPKAAKPAPIPDAAANTSKPSQVESVPEFGTKSSEGKAKPPAPSAKESPLLPAARTEPPAPAPSDTAQIAPVRPAFTGAAVACDPGKSVLYDGPKEVSLWVTRAGSVTVTNPLRPLTPDVTRVLQIVIAGKLATVYGPDLNAVRRGGAPTMLEAALGGPIRWDAALGTLPDALDIVADSGATVAEMRFKECGDAPAAKASPVAKAKTEKLKQAKKTAAPAQAGAASTAPAPGGLPQRRMPQGAIAE